jgi:uncharacterized oligopeptide transporter (OPT) family protein
LWPGAAILVGAGLTSFALDYKSIARAFTGIGAVFDRSKRNAPTEGIAAVEAPDWWFPAGLLFLTPAIVALMYLMYDIPVYAGVIAVPLAVLRNLTGNIMSANVTGGIGLHAADLLTTLKTGWLLGAKPRHQVYAQLLGVVAGAAMIVPLFYLVVPVAKLGTDEWPAPSAIVWANVSKVFVDGIGALPWSAKIAILVGGAFGIGMTLIEKVVPKNVRPWLPSPSALGLAMVVPFSNSLAMFVGATVAWWVTKQGKYGKFIVPIASGVIAGESITGIVITVVHSLQ